MTSFYEFDELDKSILAALMKDARIPFMELGRILNVSAGTIHVRVDKLKDIGVIQGYHLDVNYQKLGFDVCCFIGIILKSAKDQEKVLRYLEQFSEVVEAYYTTGHYNLFIKVITKNNDYLYEFLVKKLQHIEEIQSTETLISFRNPIQRMVTL
jgi:Lrp/AsnC family transcriptional regulator, regulator for asnA, asnC and gidA